LRAGNEEGLHHRSNNHVMSHGSGRY